MNLQKGLCVLDRRLYFTPVPHDAGVRHQRLQLLWAILGNNHGIKAVEGPAERLPLFQDREPGQPRLKALQNQHLEELPVVMLRPPPLLVVVGDVELGGRVSPAATL